MRPHILSGLVRLAPCFMLNHISYSQLYFDVCDSDSLLQKFYIMGRRDVDDACRAYAEWVKDDEFLS